MPKKRSSRLSSTPAPVTIDPPLLPNEILRRIDEYVERSNALALRQGARCDVAYAFTEEHGRDDERLVAHLAKTLPEFADCLRRATEWVTTQYMQEFDAWAKDNGVNEFTDESFDRFDSEYPALIKNLGNDMECQLIAGGLEDLPWMAGCLRELAKASIDLGCDKQTSGAFNKNARLLEDYARGRVKLAFTPTTWAEARPESMKVLQSEAIDGVPLDAAISTAM